MCACACLRESVCRVLLLLLLLRVDCVIFALNNLAGKCFMRRRQQSSSSSSASRAEADCAFASRNAIKKRSSSGSASDAGTKSFALTSAVAVALPTLTAKNALRGRRRRSRRRRCCRRHRILRQLFGARFISSRRSASERITLRCCSSWSQPHQLASTHTN